MIPEIDEIEKRLQLLDPISLDEMSGIKLMNRIDTKYLIPVSLLPKLLEKAQKDYYVQQINGLRKAYYRTLYYDTDDAMMYTIHHNQKLNRQKIRVREYVESDLIFLEVKNKSNKGRTKKVRISLPDLDIKANEQANLFIGEKANYPMEQIFGRLQNKFHRITLVNKGKTERLTIDFDIQFENKKSGNCDTIPELCIVEVKRDGNVFSPFTTYLADFRVQKKSISKYCLGMILTDTEVKKNRFKEKLRYIDKFIRNKR